MVKAALFLVRILRIPIEMTGVNYRQFEILLKMKLTIDSRTGSGAFQKNKREKNTFIYQSLAYAFYGVLLGIITYNIKDLLLVMTIFFMVLMVILIMVIITDFTTILFDHRDNQILLPRPIGPRTLLLVRLVHIQFFTGLIALSLSLGTIAVIGIKYNLVVVLVLILSILLSQWLTIVITTFIYLLISKVVNGEKFKDILTAIQIIIGIAVFAGYQITVNVLGKDLFNASVMTIHSWSYLMPPFWYAAIVKFSTFQDMPLSLTLLIIPGVILPLAGLWVLTRFLSKGFNEILGERTSENSASDKKRKKGIFNSDIIKKALCISETEKAGWHLAYSTMRRDRKFKQNVYPYFGIMLVFALVILKPDISDPAGAVKSISGYSRYLFLLAFFSSGFMAVFQLPYTDNPEAAWIYRVLPIEARGDILSGAIKSMLMKFSFSVFLLVSILFLWFWGFGIIVQLLLSYLVSTLILLLLIKLQKMDLPFSLNREKQQQGPGVIYLIFSMILIFLFAWLINYTSSLPVIIPLTLCLLVAGIIILTFRNIRKWEFSRA